MTPHVTIVGTGNMARAIGTRLSGGGVPLSIAARDLAAATALAEELSSGATAPVQAEAFGGPLAGDVVVLAVPYGALPEVVAAYGSELAGKTVVDISNPVDWSTFDALVTPAGTSAAEELARLLPAGTSVVKAFNTTFATPLGAGNIAGRPLDVYLAADDDAARATVSGLVEAGGLNPVDTGPLRRARELEAFQLLHITIQERLGTGFASAIAIIPPGAS